MSVLEALAKVKSGIWQFIRLVHNTNRDLPFVDYAHFDETNTPTSYRVGANQQDAGGIQQKAFTSKSTLIYCTEDITLRLNSQNNVGILILAATWYEFKSNISSVYIPAVTQDKDLYLYFDGVLPDEARSPE